MGVKYHLKCHSCNGHQFHGADRAKHIREIHGGVPPEFTKVDKYGNPWTGEHATGGSVKPAGIIRVGHEQEQEDIQNYEKHNSILSGQSPAIQKFEHFDTIPARSDASLGITSVPQSGGLPEEEEEEDTTTDEEDEPVYKKVNYGNNINVNRQSQQPQNYAKHNSILGQSPIQRQVIVKNFKDTETIKNVEGLNRRLTEVINNFNGHIKKLYSEKANKADVDNLYRKVNGLNSSIGAIRRTLTEQSRMAGGVYNVYKHSKKHRSKTGRKVKKQVEKIVKNKVGGNSNAEEVLKNVNININAQKLSIERAYKLIQSLDTRLNTLKARVEGHETRLKSVEETNNVILKNQLTEEDVVRIVKRILSKEGRSVETEEIVDIIHNNDKENNTTDEEETIEDEEEEKDKEVSKHFKDEMDEVVDRMRLTKNDGLNKTTIKTMKKVIEKHSNMGHLGDIKKYMEALPKNKTKNNKKKAVTRKHLHTVIKNIEVK